MKKLFVVLLVALSALAPIAHSEGVFDSVQSSLFNDEPSLMPVDQAFAFDFAQQGNQLKVNFVIADGYYLYRDKLKFSVSDATLGEIQLPKGKIHHDDYFGEQQVYYTYVDIPLALKQAGTNASLSVTFMGCAEGKLCYPPTTRKVNLKPVADNAGLLPNKTPTEQDKSLKNEPLSEQNSLSQMLSGNDNLLLTLLIFFGLGVGLALTPCVFPMYPILSGIIVGQKQKLTTAKAFGLSMAYVQGMAITYALLGLVVASAGLKYQAALQHPVVLVVLAILFAILSLSMFGVYDIRLPDRWQNKLNNVSQKQQGGNILGVFVMGIISGLVASPCTTAPLSGVLIYVAQSGNLLLGFLTLYVLAMGMGLPLLLLGTSGGKLLPKAGQWMNLVKTIFGFLLLAVSIIMLSRIWSGLVIDLTWSLWGLGLITYLMHQNKLSEFSWKQTVRSVLLTLALLAAFSYGFQAVMSSLGYSASVLSHSESEKVGKENTFKTVASVAELQQALALAKAENKPVLLDFYADWCVACKEFEHITFADLQVQQKFNEMVLLKADVTKTRPEDIELMEHYHVLGLPTLLLFDASGNQVPNLTITGFMGAKEFSSHLDKLLN